MRSSSPRRWWNTARPSPRKRCDPRRRDRHVGLACAAAPQRSVGLYPAHGEHARARPRLAGPGHEVSVARGGDQDDVALERIGDSGLQHRIARGGRGDLQAERHVDDLGAVPDREPDRLRHPPTRMADLRGPPSPAGFSRAARCPRSRSLSPARRSGPRRPCRARPRGRRCRFRRGCRRRSSPPVISPPGRTTPRRSGRLA